ncbi:MAG: hypothetical protein WBD14_09940, partial [Phycisphaerae bacterium]
MAILGRSAAVSVRGETPGPPRRVNFVLAEPGEEVRRLECPGLRARAEAAAQAIPITQGRAGG